MENSPRMNSFIRRSIYPFIFEVKLQLRPKGKYFEGFF
jgi:hypothetical protein